MKHIPIHSADWWAGYDGEVAAERCQRCFDAGRSKRAIERGMTTRRYFGSIVSNNSGARCRLVGGHEGECEGRE